MTFWGLMLYAFFVFIGLVIVFLVLPKLFARLIRRDAKPRSMPKEEPKAQASRS